ncbi:MAG: undecaprenyl-diphosphate phosphatase [Candidatus Eisenbacteria bacterium]|uniref:Undecaprenyl-diphosphatase n=1 Tax=Eiseniibacteriota bacterium TaxID=2212470 RepID=A0A538U269_UNCEI|nr:MAG: undecaprenyl-diphosphate phosphatase [Candidatus Eisenbacteria bacterium]
MLACRAMSPVQAALLGVIQGLTEFLPISSSAHLYLVPTLLHWRYAGVAFDVALHWGTLLALVLAFWRDWWNLARAPFVGSSQERADAIATWLKLAVASVPAAIAGVLLEPYTERWLRSLPLQAATLAVFGFLLWWVDRVRPQRPPPASPLALPPWGTCLLMGVAQSLALVPGVSRSGVTITAGRATGTARVEAARLSFLLATPITFGAGLLEWRHLSPDLPATTLAIGVAASAITGFFAIRGLLRWLARAGFGWFFAYRAVLASILLIVTLRR